MTVVAARHPEWRRTRRGALAVGVVGLGLCLVGAVVSARAFFLAYLFAYFFWLGLALGCAALVMVQYLARGLWGVATRRLFEAGALLLPLMALLFVPLLFGLHQIYAWAQPAAVAGSALLRHKRLYLNVPFFVARAAGYFVIWSGLAYCLNRWSLEHDRTADPALLQRLRLFRGGGLVAYILTATFASVDWIMSLEADWFSTIYGFLVIVGQGLVALAFVIIVAVLLSDRPPLAAAITPARLNDLGNLLLTAVMLWAYMAFAQFLIIWAGNLPEENSWYLHRTGGSWKWIPVVAGLLHFALPFVLLLFRHVKRRARLLVGVAALLLIVHLIDTWWLVIPTFYPAGLHVDWLDAAAPVGIGGVWLAAFVWILGRRPLLPLRDPKLQEVLGHE